MKKPALIVLESTSYPGTTDELIRDVLKKDGLLVDHDFFLCFSPERVDPGNSQYLTYTTPKVIGGTTPASLELGIELYGQIVPKVIPVSNTSTAEMVKLLENTFRSVNIGFINEMARLCEVLGIDIWEVIEAASTKPFGFMPFYPGPGVGGHCIPLDPMYLAWKAKGYNFFSRYIELSQDINRNMPQHVIEGVSALLNHHGKPLKGSRVLVMGVAYKAGVNDARESPGLEVLDRLSERGVHVDYADPHIAELVHGGRVWQSVPLHAEELGNYDCVVLVTAHREFDYQLVAAHARLIYDTRNAFGNHPNVWRLGSPLNRNIDLAVF